MRVIGARVWMGLAAVTAAASGTVAALDAEHYLATLPEDLLAAAGDPEFASVTN